MTLHEDQDLLKQAIRATSEWMGIPEIYIEKDYWVCLALHQIFHSSYKDVVLFKGGTSLSKCYKIIERFSEDIDLYLLTDQQESDYKKKKTLKAVTKSINPPFQEMDIESITIKMGFRRKIAFEYPKTFKMSSGPARDKIIVEATIFGGSEPHSKKSINSYIYDFMIEEGRKPLATKYNMSPFDINVLDVRRTFCEKIMSLVRFSHSETSIQSLRDKVRHYYDLHQLLSLKEIKSFLDSEEFPKMLEDVAEKDILAFRKDLEWLEIHPKKSIVFDQVPETWNKLDKAYKTEFSKLIYGDLPDPKMIKKSIKQIAARLKEIEWTIKVEDNEV